MQLKGETVLQLAINCGDSQQALADINISHYWNTKATTEEHVATTDAQPKIFQGKAFCEFRGSKQDHKKVSLTVNSRCMQSLLFIRIDQNIYNVSFEKSRLHVERFCDAWGGTHRYTCMIMHCPCSYLSLRASCILKCLKA